MRNGFWYSYYKATLSESVLTIGSKEKIDNKTTSQVKTYNDHVKKNNKNEDHNPA